MAKKIISQFEAYTVMFNNNFKETFPKVHYSVHKFFLLDLIYFIIMNLLKVELVFLPAILLQAFLYGPKWNTCCTALYSLQIFNLKR